MADFASEVGSALQKMNASELICNLLVNFGVTHVYGGHGGAVVPLIDAIMSHPKLTWVYNRCEVNSAQAAMADAKLNNRLGCCVATSGPGAGHLLSGLVDADQDRVPLLCLTGLKDSGSTRHADFQDIDQGAIFRMAGLGLSESCSSINQLIPLLRNALYMSVSNYRCSHLAIPIDVQLASVTVPKVLNFRPDNLTRNVLSHSSSEEIRTLATALIKEKMDNHHMVIFSGWRATHLGSALQDIAEFLRVPIITSYDGKGTVNEAHENSFGVAGMYGFVGGGRSHTVMENCDVVVTVCLPDLSKALANKNDMQVRRLIQIETDLVAGDTSRYIATHSFESHDLKHCLPLVLEAMKKEKEAMKLVFECGFGDRHKKRLSVMPTQMFPAKEGTCHPGIFFQNMSSCLKDDAILCADIGDNALWMASGVVATKGQRTLTSEHMGIMGFSLNAALAASISTDGKRQVLAVAGDGGFQMSLNELATLKDHGCKNVLVVIIVNGRLGRVNNESWGPGLRGDGCSIGSPDFVKLFEAYGYPNGKHLTTSDDKEIEKAITEGWELASSQGVAVLVVHQDPDTHPIMHKISPASGQTMWDRYLKEMNREHQLGFKRGGVETDEDAIPGFSYSKQSEDKLDSLKDWVNSHKKTAVSEYTWVGENFLSVSPATIFQHQLSEMCSDAPDIFETQEEKDSFDKDFWRVAMKSFSVEELGEMFDHGSSNGYPLRLQTMVLPKNTMFKLHAHPNIELSIALLGTLYHNQMTDYVFPRGKLERDSSFGAVAPTDESINDLMKKFETCMVIDDQGDRSTFVETVYASRGQCGINQTGSVHQSFSAEDSGAILFVLWSGCHANIMLPNVKHKRGAEVLRDVDVAH